MSSLASRISERLQATGISPAELARACKVKPPSVSDWISGNTKTIKGENLLRAAHALQCSPHWLATGLGTKSAENTPSVHEVREEVVAYITDKLIDEATALLRQLDRTSRAEALHWLRGFAAGRKTGSDHHSAGDDHPLATSTGP